MDMKKYLIEVFFYFLLPATLIAAVAEFSLRKIPNDYAYKNQWLTQNSYELEVLALGTSSILHDIDPHFLRKNGFNAAHLSQSLRYDHFIFNKFIDRMPSLEYVILGIDYWSPYGDIAESPEWWRVKYYNIHYGSKLYRWEGKYNFELYFRDIGTFKRAAKGFFTLMGLMNESHITINDKGHGVHYTFFNRAAEWDNGEMEATRHNELIRNAQQDGLIEQNKAYVEDIIRKCAERNVMVILLNVPLFKTYREHQISDFVDQQKAFCNYFAEKYENVLYADFSNHPDFTEKDFYDANHLNDRGTKKFTLMLDNILSDSSSRFRTTHKINRSND